MWGGAGPGHKLHVALNVFSCCNSAHNTSWRVRGYLYPALDLGLLPRLALVLKWESHNLSPASF